MSSGSSYLPAPAVGGPAIHKASPLLRNIVQWGAVLAIGLLVILAFPRTNNWATGLPQTVNLGAPQAGSNVALQVGDTLQVTLAGNPSTGYSWSTEGLNTAILQPTGEPQFQAFSSALGAGGNVISRFTAVGQGQTILKMIYSRPFEKNVAPINSFAVTVVVGGSSPLPGSYP